MLTSNELPSDLRETALEVALGFHGFTLGQIHEALRQAEEDPPWFHFTEMDPELHNGAVRWASKTGCRLEVVRFDALDNVSWSFTTYPLGAVHETTGFNAECLDNERAHEVGKALVGVHELTPFDDPEALRAFAVGQSLTEELFCHKADSAVECFGGARLGLSLWVDPDHGGPPTGKPEDGSFRHEAGPLRIAVTVRDRARALAHAQAALALLTEE